MLLARSRFTRPLLLAGALSLAPLACQEADPKNPATWIAKLDDSDPKKVVDALTELRKLKAKQAVTNIIPLLKNDSGDVREAAAYALAEIGDKSAVEPLIQAIDLASDAKGSDRANAKIADALGMLGDTKAVPDLIKMTNSRVALVKLHAVEALGKLKDPRVVPVLQKFITDEDAPPLITKEAIIGLGEMKAVPAIPELAEALVTERKGVSFVSEASFALMEIGKPAAKSMVAIMDGADQDYVKWAAEHHRRPASYMAKGSTLLGDIDDKDSIPVLVKTLQWKNEDDSTYEEAVHGLAAEALGRMRAAEAAAPLANAFGKVVDANMRAKYALALAQIGDKKVLPKIEASIKDRKATITEREESITGLAMLGDSKNLPVLEGLKKSDPPEALKKQCIEAAGDSDGVQQSCAKLAGEWVKFVDDETARLKAGDCHEDTKCWAEKLKDPAWKVRERAAYELGKLGTPDAVKALLGAFSEDKTQVRRAIYIALDWATQNPATKDVMKQNADMLAAQYDQDKSSAIMQVVNEDLKRVVWKAKSL